MTLTEVLHVLSNAWKKQCALMHWKDLVANSEAFATLQEKEKISGVLCCQGLAVVCFQYSGPCKLIFSPRGRHCGSHCLQRLQLTACLGSHANGKQPCQWKAFYFFQSVHLAQCKRAIKDWICIGIIVVVCVNNNKAYAFLHPALLCKGLISFYLLVGGWGVRRLQRLLDDRIWGRENEKAAL